MRSALRSRWPIFLYMALALAFFLPSCADRGGILPTAGLPGTGTLSRSGALLGVGKPQPVSKGTGTAKFIIKVPSSSSSSTNPKSGTKKPLYVSQSTQSMTVSINGGGATSINLSPTSPNCSANGSYSGSYICTSEVAAPAGSDTFAVNAYDGTNGAGNQLSTASFTQTITAGTTNNVTMTLDGIVTSIALSLSQTTIPADTPAAVTLYVTAKDADGNVIVGPGNYNNGITLSDSDTSGDTSLSSTSISAPSTSSVTVNYSGACGISSATFSASASGATDNPATLTIATSQTFSVGTGPDGIAIDASGNIWVANSGSGNVTELNSSGATLGTFSVGNSPLGIAIDASGNVWVTNKNGDNVTELSSSGGGLGTYAVVSTPEGIAIDASGNVWVTNEGSGNVTKLSSSGATLGTFSAGNTPTGIAIDASGNVWVANYISNNVTELSSSGATLGTFSAGNTPTGIAIDASGNVWVADSGGGGGNTVTELSSSGATLGAFSVGTYPLMIAIDSSRNVWVANYVSNNVTELSSSGTTLGTFSVRANPFGIAVDASGNVWVPNNTGGSVTKLLCTGAKGPQFFPYTGPQWPVGY